MRGLMPLLAMGVAFIATRFATMWLFRQISPPPVNATHLGWWGTYASLLISITVAFAVLALMHRRTSRE